MNISEYYTRKLLDERRKEDERKKKERKKHAIKMQRVFVLFQRCYSRQKTNQDNRRRMSVKVAGKRVNLHRKRS